MAERPVRLPRQDRALRRDHRDGDRPERAGRRLVGADLPADPRRCGASYPEGVGGGPRLVVADLRVRHVQPQLPPPGELVFRRPADPAARSGRPTPPPGPRPRRAGPARTRHQQRVFAAAILSDRSGGGVQRPPGRGEGVFPLAGLGEEPRGRVEDPRLGGSAFLAERRGVADETGQDGADPDRCKRFSARISACTPAGPRAPPAATRARRPAIRGAVERVPHVVPRVGGHRVGLREPRRHRGGGGDVQALRASSAARVLTLGCGPFGDSASLTVWSARPDAAASSLCDTFPAAFLISRTRPKVGMLLSFHGRRPPLVVLVSLDNFTTTRRGLLISCGPAVMNRLRSGNAPTPSAGRIRRKPGVGREPRSRS